MRNNLTELVFILDGSGSMYDMKWDTIGGFNSLIEEQRQQPGRVLVSTVIFNSHSRVVYDRVDIEHIAPMTGKDYVPEGSTALLDALGGAIHYIGNVHKYSPKYMVPEKTLFVIITDGMENASCRYTGERVRHMVERQRERYGWEFIFLGANIDAVAVGREYGIDEGRAVTYEGDKEGTRRNYRAVSKAVSAVRLQEELKDSWKGEIDEYRNSKNNE